MPTEYFTPSWRRSRRKNDVIIAPPSSSSPLEGKDGSPSSSSKPIDLKNANPFWWRYPCVVCNKQPPSPKANNTTSPAPASHHKRCSRCHSVVYCSSHCQKQDYSEGKHKGPCMAIGELWEEKSRLEKECFWKSKPNKKLSKKVEKKRSTNPFDDDYDDNFDKQDEKEVENQEDQNEDIYDYPIIGQFWHDHPKSELQKRTTEYCVVLLQLVQLLGRAESWRVSRIQQSQPTQQPIMIDNDKNNTTNSSSTRRRGHGNPLARELAIDVAFTLLHLDQTDMRVRLLIPPLLLEGGYLQEAYDFLRHWLHVETSMRIMDLALMGSEMGIGGMVGATDNAEQQEGNSSRSSLVQALEGMDMLESPEKWLDGEMVYPSIGFVFELAFLKCHLLCSLKNGFDMATFGTRDQSKAEPMTLRDRCAAVGKEELERQVRLLLSLVHKWNSHLLPKLGEEHYGIQTGASAPSTRTNNAIVEDGVTIPATPPALSSLLNKHPPGVELQYKMGNPGGGSVDEAVAIWQRDMILWHVIDPTAMVYLSKFCAGLEVNLVDTHFLKGGIGSDNRDHTVGNSGFVNGAMEGNAEKRKEAEDLVAKLKRENPERSMDEIMMHPEMAQLMIKHLHTGS